MKIVNTKSAKETESLGFVTAKKVKNGQVFLLYGDLGAGKTTFTKGFAKGMGVKNRIISPTFTIIRDFEILKNKELDRFYHIDLYRLNSSDEVEDLGLYDLFNDKNVVIIEWPEKMGDRIPKNATKIKIGYKKNSEREIIIK